MQQLFLSLKWTLLETSLEGREHKHETTSNLITLFRPYSLKGERIGVLWIIIPYMCSGDKTLWNVNDLFKVLECFCSSITSLWFSISDVLEWKTEYRITSNQKLLMFFGLLPHNHLTLTLRAGRGSMSVLMGTKQSRSNGYHLGMHVVSLEHFQHNTQKAKHVQPQGVCPYFCTVVTETTACVWLCMFWRWAVSVGTCHFPYILLLCKP